MLKITHNEYTYTYITIGYYKIIIILRDTLKIVFIPFIVNDWHYNFVSLKYGIAGGY